MERNSEGRSKENQRQTQYDKDRVAQASHTGAEIPKPQRPASRAGNKFLSGFEFKDDPGKTASERIASYMDLASGGIVKDRTGSVRLRSTTK